MRCLHRIELRDDGSVRVTLSAGIDRPMAPIYGHLLGRNIAGYRPAAVRQLVATADARTLSPA